MGQTDDDDGDTNDRRRLLEAMVAGGSVLFVGGAAAPAAAVALAPALSKSEGRDRWVRVARLSDLKDGEPKRAAVISDMVDAYTHYAKENLGAVWLTRSGD